MNMLSDDASNILSKTLETLGEIINAWIKGTIGGNMFGKEITTSSISLMSNSSLRKPKEEFDVS